MIKVPILQEDITVLDGDVPNHRATIYMRQKIMEPKGEIDKSTNVVGCSSSPFSVTG